MTADTSIGPSSERGLSPRHRRTIRGTFVAGAMGLVFGFGAWAVSGSNEVGWSVVAIIALVVVRVPTRSGIQYSLSLAAVVAALLVLLPPGAEQDPRLIFWAVIFGAVGLHLTIVVLGGAKASRQFLVFLRHVLVSIVAVGVYVLAAEILVDVSGIDSGATAVAITIASIVWFVLDVVIAAVEASVLDAQNLSHRVAVGLREWPIALSMMASGALFGLARNRIPVWWWALGVTLIPYMMAHVAFLRAHETRRTYRQTIRALSRIPEVSSYSPQGHGDRTAAFSLAIGQELGMRPNKLEDLEFAAQMHDIGRITLNQASIVRMGFTDEDIARWGSEMIGEVPFLEEVAELVRRQHAPYRRPGQDRDGDLPLGAKIIKAASAYDHATTELGFLALEALEVLHRGAAYDYDPDVVSAIRTVLERRGTVKI